MLKTRLRAPSWKREFHFFEVTNSPTVSEQETGRHRGHSPLDPVETANIYVLAGEILDAIETVNRIAKIAFDGRAEIMAQFNKDLTLRGGKTRKATAAEDDEESRAL